jgi:predicted nucleic acid-binding protein
LLLLAAASRECVFWPDATSPAVMPEVRTAGTAKQITDRFLLGLARRYGGRVIALDRSLAAAGGDDVVSCPDTRSRSPSVGNPMATIAGAEDQP